MKKKKTKKINPPELTFEPQAKGTEINYELNINLIKPYGPTIMKSQLPIPIYKGMVKLVDTILKDKKRTNWGPNLAGQIKEEPVIDNQDLVDRDLFGFFNAISQRYIQECNGGNQRSSGLEEMQRRNPEDPVVLVTDITSMWIVNQLENEYNPVHHHTNSTISGVMYLNIPKYKPREIYGKKNLDGNIEFIYHATTEDQYSLEQGCYSISPIEGDVFLFPSYLLHTVYPFLGKGERCSVSFNVLHRYHLESELKKKTEKGISN